VNGAFVKRPRYVGNLAITEQELVDRLQVTEGKLANLSVKVDQAALPMPPLPATKPPTWDRSGDIEMPNE
jgi:hypothetical protein